jgi:hypothetical protein
MNDQDLPIKDELTELSGSVYQAADPESLYQALDRLTEYLTRQKEQQDRDQVEPSSRCW